MRHEDIQYLRSILGKGKLIEIEFEQYDDHLNINILKNPEYNTQYTIHYNGVLEYSEDSRAMRYLRQIYPDFQKCYAYTYDMVGGPGGKRENYGWNLLKKNEYCETYEHDCKFIIAVPNIKKLNISSNEECVNIGVY